MAFDFQGIDIKVERKKNSPPRRLKSVYGESTRLDHLSVQPKKMLPSLKLTYC